MLRPRYLFGALAVLVVLTHLQIHSFLHSESELALSSTSTQTRDAPSPALHTPLSSPSPPAASLASSAVGATSVEAVAVHDNPSALSLSADLPSIQVPSTLSAAAAADVATCAGTAQSCLSCVRIKPLKPPDDTGVRCVWCASLNACHGYVKGSSFPCADALRGGGGYPGGRHCKRDGETRALEGRPRARGDAGRAEGGGSLAVIPARPSDPGAILRPPPLSLAGDAANGTAFGGDAAEEARVARTAPLFFSKPASEFRAAMPLGNGRLGAMVYGGAWRETVKLSEESIIAGPRSSMAEVATAMRERAGAARQMDAAMAAGEVRAAERAAMTLPYGKVHSYEFLGDISVELAPASCASGADGGAEAGGLRCPKQPTLSYRRELDLETALASVNFQAAQCAFSRRTLVSAADDMFAMRINASCAFDVIITLARKDEKRTDGSAHVAEIEGGVGSARQALRLHGSSSSNGVSFAAVLALTAIEPAQAVARSDAGSIVVHGALDLSLTLSATTDFEQRLSARSPLSADELVTRCADTLAAAATAAPSWSQIVERHVHSHASRFGAFSLRLGRPSGRRPEAGFRSDLPTDERLRASRSATREDYGLVEQAVQLGRYLLLASSGPPATLPANLQGVWAEGARPPWGSDYHLNINLQQMYWQAGPLAISDCISPLAPFLERLAASGAHAARHLYGSRADGAWMAHGFTDAWASAAPLAPPLWSLCASCGGWAALQLWQQFEFSREASDLRKAWPLLRGSAAFFESALLHRRAGGALRWGPSHSPENAYLDGNGSTRFLSYDVALDLGVIAHTSRALAAGAEALRTLGELSDDDADLTARLSRLLLRVPGASKPRLDADDGLAEWWAEGSAREGADEGHRHFSHLYPLHPGDGIDPLAQPALSRAARRSLLRRLRHGGGHTGWSASWAASLWARLHDGGLAHAALRYTLHEFTSAALLGLHPKLGGQRSSGVKCMACVGRVGGPGDGIFQMDANGGISAAVAEMLLQSHGSTCHVHLLPALPPAWPNGEVAGMRARGAMRVDMRWAAGRLTSVTVARSSPSRPNAAIVLRDGPVSVCCSSRVCGADEAALAAATQTTVRALPNTGGGKLADEKPSEASETAAKSVWMWQITLDGSHASWSMAL